MKRLEVSGAVRHTYASLGFKGLSSSDEPCTVAEAVLFLKAPISSLF